MTKDTLIEAIVIGHKLTQIALDHHFENKSAWNTILYFVEFSVDEEVVKFTIISRENGQREATFSIPLNTILNKLL